MFYDPRIGAAITLSGQYIIKTVSETCNRRFNEFFKTTGIDYSIYSDTDSIYFTLGNIVEKYWKGIDDLKIVTALDNLMENHLRPIIDEATDKIALTQNHHKKTIYFKRENIAKGGFWCVHPDTKINIDKDITINIADLFEACDDSIGECRSVDFINCQSVSPDGIQELDKITHVMRKMYCGYMYTITDENGNKRKVTEDHMVLVKRDTNMIWVKAMDLVETDTLIYIK